MYDVEMNDEMCYYVVYCNDIDSFVDEKISGKKKQDFFAVKILFKSFRIFLRTWFSFDKLWIFFNGIFWLSSKWLLDDD